MRKLMSSLCASALALAIGGTGLAPSYAAPIGAPSVPQGHLIEVQGPQELQRGIGREIRRDRREFRGDRDFRPGREFRGQRESRADRRMHRRGNHYYYNGHRGYRDRRPGYRQVDGWWFPAAAFVAGAIIGGANQAPAAGGNAHVEWCYGQYRSYRASDNTFQPYNGPRRQCNSPYG